MDVSTQILRLARGRGILRPRDLKPLRIPRHQLAKMVADGAMQKMGRGLYMRASASLTEHHSLAEASVRVPAGVICLLSALRFHKLTTQNPHQVWLAIQPHNRKPAALDPPLRIARFSGPAFAAGVETHKIEGVEVKIYSAAKTIADCFKYRHKIGTDVALEALRAGWRTRAATADQIWRFARICRVTAVIRPYLDTLE